MQNTQIGISDAPAASSMSPNMTEGSMGKLANFNAGLNGSKINLTAPRLTKTDITSDIK